MTALITRMAAVAVACAACLARAPAARAGGFELGDVGTRGAGRSGAFVARADDPTAIDYNPAGLARLRGTRVLLSNRFTWSAESFHRARTLDWSGALHGVPPVTSFDWVHNGNPFEALGPVLAVSSDLGLDDWGFALAVYSPPATSRQTFPAEGGQKYMLVSREVVILYYSAAAAWKYKDVFGIGVTLQWVDVPRLRFALVVDGNTTARLVNPVASRFDMVSRVDGSDRVGFSGIVGLWYRPAPAFELGASARVLPVPVDANSRLSLSAQSLELSAPPSITRDGVPDDRVTFSMMLPPKLRLGGRYVHRRGERELFDLELDLGYEAWSMVDAFTMDATGTVTEVLGKRMMIGKLTVPRRWRDTWSVRVGGDWQVAPGLLAVRAGGMYESPAVPPEYAYVDIFPGHRLSAGAGLSLTFRGFDLSVSYNHLFQLPVAVTESESRVYQQVPGSPCKSPWTDPQSCAPQYLGTPGAPVNAGTYLSSYHFVAVSASYEFGAPR